MRFRLNQVVHNSMPMRYDALGDFQAALRDDMFAIHGFDEEMLLGWHCDSNLAARLALYRGTVDTLVDKVFGYHCDHTRVAAANNKGRQTKMNDLNRFIWDVATPYLPAQADSWGWPDLDIEEIRLDRDTSFERFFAGVGAAIEPAKVSYETTTLDGSPSDDLTYDVPHTLPFVCDQVLTYPRQTALMVVATRAEFLTRFSTAWRSMGFTGPILVPRECAGLPADLPGVESAPFHELSAARRDVHLRVRPGHAAQRRAGTDRPACHARSTRSASRSSKGCFARPVCSKPKRGPRATRQPRRIIGVNVIYNRYWRLFTEYVGANLNPFCSQVLAGNPRPAISMKEKIVRLRDRYMPGAPSSARLTMAVGKFHRAATAK